MTLEEFSDLFLTENTRISELIIKINNYEQTITLPKLILEQEIETLLLYRYYEVIQVSSNYAGLVIYLTI